MYRIDKTKRSVKLPKHQEIDYLNDILNGVYAEINNGSSRVVYDAGDGMVIKLALEAEGRVQNNKEISMFWQHGDTHLARIYAYGENIIIMEEVDTVYKDLWEIDYDYVDSGGLEEWTDFTQEEAEDYLETLDFLDEVLGYTSDNGQLGFRHETQSFVSYDYGFDPKNMEYSIGSIGYILCDTNLFRDEIAAKIAKLFKKKEMAIVWLLAALML